MDCNLSLVISKKASCFLLTCTNLSVSTDEFDNDAVLAVDACTSKEWGSIGDGKGRVDRMEES